MASLKDNTVYMTLNTRGVRGTFHWGIFVTSAAPRGQYYHATTKFGGWQLEVKPASDPRSSATLVLIYRIGSLSSQHALDQVLRGVPANGAASPRTGEAFNCRVWTKDALVTLQNNGITTLGADIDTLEDSAFAVATQLEPRVERGEAYAQVLE